MHLIVGLGNPGAQYADNRHNVGFMVVDELARRGRAAAPRAKFGAEILEATIGGNRLLLCKPQEYMNVSGQAVARVAGFWKIGLPEMVVVHDELDVPFDRLKLAAGGGPGGHNGVKSLISSLGDPAFARVRVGIGRPAPGRDAADYVLTDFSRAEAAVLPDLIGRAADAVEAIVGSGLTTAMNRFNGKSK
jgi:PTH1 family peptidyl-tRNA hydrolase